MQNSSQTDWQKLRHKYSVHMQNVTESDLSARPTDSVKMQTPQFMKQQQFVFKKDEIKLS